MQWKGWSTSTWTGTIHIQDKLCWKMHGHINKVNVCCYIPHRRIKNLCRITIKGVNKTVRVQITNNKGVVLFTDIHKSRYHLPLMCWRCFLTERTVWVRVEASLSDSEINPFPQVQYWMSGKCWKKMKCLLYSISKSPTFDMHYVRCVYFHSGWNSVRSNIDLKI